MQKSFFLTVNVLFLASQAAAQKGGASSNPNAAEANVKMGMTLEVCYADILNILYI